MTSTRRDVFPPCSGTESHCKHEGRMKDSLSSSTGRGNVAAVYETQRRRRKFHFDKCAKLANNGGRWVGGGLLHGRTRLARQRAVSQRQELTAAMRQVDSRLTESELMMSPEKYTVNNKDPGGKSGQRQSRVVNYTSLLYYWLLQSGRLPRKYNNKEKKSERKSTYISHCRRRPCRKTLC